MGFFVFWGLSTEGRREVWRDFKREHDRTWHIVNWKIWFQYANRYYADHYNKDQGEIGEYAPGQGEHQKERPDPRLPAF
jgi:hypothetical protein